MWAIGGSAVVALVAAMGGSTPLGHVIAPLPVYGYGDFRSWARYMVVVDLAIALLAAQGIIRFRSAESVARRRAFRRAAMAVRIPRDPPAEGRLSDTSALKFECCEADDGENAFLLESRHLGRTNLVSSKLLSRKPLSALY
jgi:hypothetical protein